MPSLRFERIDSDVLLRGIGISMVVYHHVVLYNAGDARHALFGLNAVGGMGMLLLLSGFSFARFGLHNRSAREAAAAVLSMGRSIILPCYLAILFFSLVARQFNPAEFLMIGNFFESNWQAGFNTWYPQFLLQILVVIFILFSVKPVGDRLAAHPTLGVLVLLMVSLLLHVGMREFGPELMSRQHLPWMLMWNFVLGWALFNLNGMRSRKIADGTLGKKGGMPRNWNRLGSTGLCLVVIGITLEVTETRAWATFIAALLLTWVPSLRLPKPLTRLGMILSQSALVIFILHMSVIKVFAIAFGRYHRFYAIEAVTVILSIAVLWVVCASASRAFTHLRLEQREARLRRAAATA